MPVAQNLDYNHIAYNSRICYNRLMLKKGKKQAVLLLSGSGTAGIHTNEHCARRALLFY